MQLAVNGKQSIYARTRGHCDNLIDAATCLVVAVPAGDTPSLAAKGLDGTCSSVTVLPENTWSREKPSRQIVQTVFPRSYRLSRLLLPVLRDMPENVSYKARKITLKTRRQPSGPWPWPCMAHGPGSQLQLAPSHPSSSFPTPVTAFAFFRSPDASSSFLSISLKRAPVSSSYSTLSALFSSSKP